MLSNYLIVHKSILPEYYEKVLECRRLMESAAYCVMSTLLLRDSIETPDLFDKSLKVFLDYSRSQVDGHYSVVMSWTPESMEYYK